MPDPIFDVQFNMILYNSTHPFDASDIILPPNSPCSMLVPLAWTIDPECRTVGRKIINRRVDHRISLGFMA